VTSVVVRTAVAAGIRAHARDGLPNEACGVVSGRDGVGERFHAARNALASPHRFDLEPEDLVRIMLGIEAAGDELVAVVHSHPVGRAVPSPADVREARYPVPLIICGPVATEAAPIRAWRVSQGRATELRLVVEDQHGSPDRTMRRPDASRTTSTEHEPSSSPER
jgi:proteasome lid subunit RPN8/RPN11